MICKKHVGKISSAGVMFFLSLFFLKQVHWWVYSFDGFPSQDQLIESSGFLVKSDTRYGIRVKLDDGSELSLKCGFGAVITCVSPHSDNLDIYGRDIYDTPVTVRWFKHEYTGKVIYELDRFDKHEISYADSIELYSLIMNRDEKNYNPEKLKLSIMFFLFFIVLLIIRDKR